MLKKLAAISLIFTLFLQAIPVVHLLSKGDTIFFAYIDEDKPEDGKTKEKKDSKEFVSGAHTYPEQLLIKGQPDNFYIHPLHCPYLESFIPPPDMAA